VPYQTILKKTPYELLKDKKPNMSYFKVFTSKCYIHSNGKKNLDNFDAKSDEGIFVGYSSISKAYSMYNKHNKVIEESLNVTFDETNNGLTSTSLFEEFQLSEYIDDKDEEVQDKYDHQNIPINMDQCLDQNDKGHANDLGTTPENSQDVCDRPQADKHE